MPSPPNPRHKPVPVTVPLQWLAGVLLILMALLAFSPALRAGFIWDDDRYVTENPFLTSPNGLEQIWFSAHSQSQYFPLVYTTFRFEYVLWGLNPLGYHLVNVLLHGCNAILAWRLLRQLAVPGAWLAAAIFAIHPVQVETVAWVTELKNVESTLFYLLALRWWLKSCDETGRRAWGFYALTFLSSLLALFAKTTACTLPAAMVLVLWMQRKPIGWRHAGLIAPVWLLGIAFGLLSIWWERHLGNYGPQYGLGFSLAERLLMASRAIWFYALKLLLPINLMFSYPRWDLNAKDPVQYLWLVTCLLAAGLLWWKRDKVGRGVIAGVVFFVAALSPLLGVISNYTFRFTFVADHYQYLAALGLISVFASVVVQKWNIMKLGFVPRVVQVCALLAVLGTLTWRQSMVYRDARSVWEDTMAKNPGSWIAHNNLGVCLDAMGEHAKALEQFRKAIELNPKEATTHNDYAVALERDGKFDDAAEHYARALELEPGFAIARFNLGVLKAHRGDLDGAIQDFSQAIAIQPRLAKAEHAWGLALARQGKLPAAILHYHAAVELEPAMFVNHFDLGNALLAANLPEEAEGCFRRALVIDPKSTSALINLGRALLMKGRTRDAVSALREALTIDPANVPALNNLGGALFRLGDLPAAADCFRKAVQVEPTDPELRFNLGRILVRQGNLEEARRQFNEALRLKPDFAEAKKQLDALNAAR
jgi:tetratricopeptide (TPR) repeat protein